MKRNFIALCALLLAACGSQEPKITLFSNEAFQTEADGKPVGIYTLRAGDVTMQVTNYGARVVSLWTPDRAGDYEDIVLGYETIDRYINNDGERFLGAVVGPYANRIAKGSFTLDGTEYNLPINNNGQTLHGGIDGLDRVVWDVVSASEDQLVMKYLHADGQEGFPGNLQIEMTYSLTPENEFRIDYSATTDKPTVVNLSHHPFFNLKGEGNGTILDHVMTINASHTTPVDSVLIPTGEIADVTGTPFDFRQPHAIGERIGADNEQLRNGAGYDHNWVLDRKTAAGSHGLGTRFGPHDRGADRPARHAVLQRQLLRRQSERQIRQTAALPRIAGARNAEVSRQPQPRQLPLDRTASGRRIHAGLHLPLRGEIMPAPVETHERRRRGSPLAAAFSVGPGTPDCLRASVRRRGPAPEIRPTGS